MGSSPKKQRDISTGAGGAGGAAAALAALLLRPQTQTTVSRTCPPPYPPADRHPEPYYPFSGLFSWHAAAAAAAAAVKLAEEKAAAEAATAKFLEEKAAAEAAAAKLAEEKAAAEAVAVRKAQREAAAAKLAEEKAVAEATAALALKAQQEAAFPELALWRLEVENVVGKVGTAVKQTAPASRYHELRQTAVHHVINPVLQTAYERKKKALAARLGGAANINEQFLFHGTTLSNSDAIIINNFCLSKVGSSTGCTGLYGRGFYFSANIITGAAYAGGSGAVLLCKVLVGKCHDMQGKAHTGCRRQPNFDSHVSDTRHPPHDQQIVAFEPEQVLPIYRIAL